MKDRQACVLAYIQEDANALYRRAVVSTISTNVLVRTNQLFSKERAERLSHEAPFFNSVAEARAFLEEVCDATVLSS